MKWQAYVVASLVVGCLSAQAPPAPPPAGGESKPADRVTRRAEDMRDQIVKGDQQVISHVRVALRLKNGNKLTGVVKDGRLVERVDGLRFVDAQAKDRGAGIRLWYSEGTRSYIFIGFRDLESYEVLQCLSNKQLTVLEQEMQMAERRAAERFAAERAIAGKAKLEKETQAAGEAGTGPKEGEAKKQETEISDEEAARIRQEQADAELLKKWPPKEGWNEAKRNEISRRVVVIGAVPQKHELEFVEKFDEWMQACERAGIDPNAPQREQVDKKELRRRLRPGK